MLLRVADFGCVPDGRYLRRVSVDQRDLTAPDGILRQTDVGKKIAIPGADDLVGVMALIDGRTVRGTRIEASTNTLFADTDAFTEADLGLRVMVPGACSFVS